MGGETDDQEAVFIPSDTWVDVASLTLQGAGLGLVISSLQNTVAHHNKGMMGVFTRSGGTIGYYAAVAAAWQLGFSASNNFRQKTDYINSFNGGCAAGFLMGMRQRNIPAAMGGCAFVGSVMATVHYTATYGTRTAGLPREQQDAIRSALYKKRPVDENVNMAVFGDRAEKIRQTIRSQVEARDGPAAGL